ncbi:hypothetical protein [Kitasatospora sp. NPDC097643]|uniref:hypothetical protein n=1 Tax=Kitasatospora sp. NPDC097643 TaxID=3157230 RepID=UPI0033347A59
MNMPLATARPPATTMDGGPAGAANGPGATNGGPGGDPDDGDDSGTDGRVDGTAQEPSSPGIGSAEWDLLTDGVRWNAETYQLLGCDPGHGPLSLDRLPDRLPEADRPVLRRMMTDALVHGRVAVGTLRVRRADGLREYVECAGEPVLGPDGTVTALRMVLRSVSLT